MGQMTVEQRKAIALASARLRLSEGNTTSAAEQIANDPITRAAQGEIDAAKNVTNVFGRAVSPEILAGNLVTRVALGAADPIIGASQLASNFVRGGASPINENQKQLESLIREGRAQSGDTGLDVPRILGNALSPIGIGVSKAIAPAASAAGRVGQSAGIGTAFGAAAPVETNGDNFFREKLGQMAAGAAAGATMGTAIEGGKIFLNLVNNATGPLRQAWRDASARSWILDKVFGGDQQARLQASQAIDTAIKSGKPMTVADAMALANMGRQQKSGGGLVAIEDRLTTMPVAADAAKSVAASQEAGRMAQLGTIAKTPSDLAAAERLRDTTAAINYPAAGQQSVTPDATFMGLLKRPGMLQAAKNANTVVQNEFGRKLNLSSVSDLQIVKESLDGVIKNPERFGIAAREQGALIELQNQFVKWLSNKSPQWESARLAYAAQSKPINQMQIGQQLQESLRSGTGVERPSAFATAVRNAPQTLKKATGQARYDDMTQILTPRQMKAVDTVSNELARDAERIALGKNVNVNQVFGIAEEGKTSVRIPNLLSRPAMVTNWVMHTIGQGADEAIAKDMAALMVNNPPAFAKKYLTDVPSAIRGKVLNEMIQKYRPVAMQAAIGMGRQSSQQDGVTVDAYDTNKSR